AVERLSVGLVLADRLLQVSGLPEYFMNSEVPCGSFQGVCQALRFLPVRRVQCSCDLCAGRPLFLGKLNKQIPIQILVSPKTSQSGGDVHTLNGRQSNFMVMGCGPSPPDASKLLHAGPTGKRGKEGSGIDGLADMVIHSRFQATSELIRHHVSGHGDDGQLLQTWPSAQ